MNILIFGPNGSGKGAQSSLIANAYRMNHVESGDLFRNQIQGSTSLGLQAKEYIGRGDLVPDEITIPMVLSELKGYESTGWLLDGFPRNLNQAETLYTTLIKNGVTLDHVIELSLEREVARKRIKGRRICEKSSHHPNNINTKAIEPINGKCRVCGGNLKIRADDQDEEAINKRHNIYYDVATGTLAAANYFKTQESLKYITVNADRKIEEISTEILMVLKKA
jgi:adenylate kinase